MQKELAKKIAETAKKCAFFGANLKSRSNTIQLKIAKLFRFQFESCVNDRDSSQNSFYPRWNSFMLGPKAQEKIRSINIKPTIVLEDTFLLYSQFLPYFEQKVLKSMKMN